VEPGEHVEYEPEESPSGGFLFFKALKRTESECEGCGRRFTDADSYIGHLPTARRL
jgi:hypothetical protein